MKSRIRSMPPMALLAAWAAALAPAPPARAQQVYKADFQGRVGAEFSSTHTASAARGGRRFLGPFANETVRLRLTRLGAHAFVTVRFDLLVMGGWDGNGTVTAQDVPAGADQWGLAVEDGPTLFHTTFANGSADPNVTQAYPACLWQGRLPARTGAAERDTLGCPAPAGDSVYVIARTFRHAAGELRLNFYGMGLQPGEGECWGIDNLTVAVSAGAPKPAGGADQKALEAFWKDLVGADAAQSESAAWGLAAAGEPAVALIEKHWADRPEGPREPPGLRQAVAKLIRQLDHDDWRTRERATADLKNLGEPALPLLREHLKAAASEEARLRIESILVLPRPAPKPDPLRLRRRRAARVLALIGTPAARKALIRLTGAPAGGEAFRPGTRWEGFRCHGGANAVAMVLTVTERKGNAVAGTIGYPTLGKTQTRFAGTIEGHSLRLRESQLVLGQKTAPLVLVFYRGRVVAQTIIGAWRAKHQPPGTGFLLHLAPPAPGK